jgi:membrane-bound lytic murein transglycosylase C
MKTIQILSILLIAFISPIILLTYDRIDFSLSAKKSEQHKQTELSEFEKNKKELDEGFKAFRDSYNEEFEAYKQDISKQWGEFKDASPSVWVSYENSGKLRRTVDYKTSEVQVEMIVNKGTSIEQVKGKLDKAVYRLMNTTEKEAYNTDVVANRVEQKLAKFENVLQKGEMSNERLFSMNDYISLKINHDGYLKVSSNARNVAVTDVRASAKSGKDIIRVSFKIPHSIHQKAVRYAAAVTTAAEKEKINDELIYAIMETESSFNPMAKSHIPAYGLMQIVPHTAGKDATNYLYGKAKILAPSYLYKPENNITIGAAYLHVLHYKYMRRVKNKESRMYCAIAAYNTGASNVAKAFINQASFNKAVAEINKLSSREVYDKLKNFLPRKETRTYVEKVAKRMEKYL